MRAVAVVVAASLTLAPPGAVRAAWAGEPPPTGTAPVVKQINDAFALLFLVFKLAEIVGPLDFPAQGGPPDPVWGSHPGPLPAEAPPADALAPDAPALVPAAP